MMKPNSILLCYFLFIITFLHNTQGESNKCHGECTALASYYLWDGVNLTIIARAFNTNYSNIMGYNPLIYNYNDIKPGDRVNVPFKCGCLRGSNSGFLGHQFNFTTKNGNSYKAIADIVYSRLTSVEMLVEFNEFNANQRIEINESLNVPVMCSCGSRRASKDYGLFITYPLRPGENLSSIAEGVGLPEKLLMDYNPGVDFSSGSGLVFIPGKDQTGNYPPLKSRSSGIRGKVVAVLSVAGVIQTLALAACFYICIYRRKQSNERSFIQTSYDDHPMENKIGSEITLEKKLGSGPFKGGISTKHTGITVDKS